MAHQHGYPDNNQEHLDDLLGRGAGDPDMKTDSRGQPLPSGGHWVGVDMPDIIVVDEPPVHWSEEWWRTPKPHKKIKDWGDTY